GTLLLDCFRGEELETASEPPAGEPADELGDLGVELLVLGIGFTSYDSEPRRVVHETVLSPARQVRPRPARLRRPLRLYLPSLVLPCISLLPPMCSPTKQRSPATRFGHTPRTSSRRGRHP